MNANTKALLKEFSTRHPALAVCTPEMRNAFDALCLCYRNGRKALVCGNGGSASDAEHMVGELMNKYLFKRHIASGDAELLRNSAGNAADFIIDNLQMGFPAFSLVSQTSLITAISNDVSADMIFAQQVFGYGRKGDVLIALSTSGNAVNVKYALMVARSLHMVTIGLTGHSGGAMKSLCDIAICVPEEMTSRIQELHLPVYHTLCAMIEEELFGG